MKHALVNEKDEVVNVIELEPNAKFDPPKDHKPVAGRDWPSSATPVPDEMKPKVRTKSERVADMLAAHGLTPTDFKAELGIK